MRQHVVVAALLLALTACQKNETAPASAAVADGDAGFAATLHERLLDAKPGDVIEIPAGKFSFDRSLTLRADGVTIRGAGMDKSVLSFKGQKAGAEGLLVNGDDSEGFVIRPAQYAALMGRLGVTSDTTVVWYGDRHSSYATRGFWTMDYYAHPGPLHVLEGELHHRSGKTHAFERYWTHWRRSSESAKTSAQVQVSIPSLSR